MEAETGQGEVQARRTRGVACVFVVDVVFVGANIETTACNRDTAGTNLQRVSRVAYTAVIVFVLTDELDIGRCGGASQFTGLTSAGSCVLQKVATTWGRDCLRVRLLPRRYGCGDCESAVGGGAV